MSSYPPKTSFKSRKKRIFWLDGMGYGGKKRRLHGDLGGLGQSSEGRRRDEKKIFFSFPLGVSRPKNDIIGTQMQGKRCRCTESDATASGTDTGQKTAKNDSFCPVSVSDAVTDARSNHIFESMSSGAKDGHGLHMRHHAVTYLIYGIHPTPAYVKSLLQKPFHNLPVPGVRLWSMRLHGDLWGLGRSTAPRPQVPRFVPFRRSPRTRLQSVVTPKKRRLHGLLQGRGRSDATRRQGCKTPFFADVGNGAQRRELVDVFAGVRVGAVYRHAGGRS